MLLLLPGIGPALVVLLLGIAGLVLLGLVQPLTIPFTIILGPLSIPGSALVYALVF